MSIISNIASVVSPPVNDTSKDPSAAMGKDDFLKLLVAQLQQQDPLNPEDPSEFTSQLTQYSSLEQLMSVNQNLQDMSDEQAMNSMLSASSYIGRQVTMIGDGITVTTPGQASSIEFELPRDATSTTIEIYDQDGRLVRTMEAGAREDGLITLNWDGKTSSGANAAAGNYYYDIKATDAGGSTISAIPHVRGTVSSVSFQNGKTMLEVDGQTWPMDYLLSVAAA